MSISKPKVALLVGGTSPEREVSKMSGKGVLQALKKLGYPAIVVDPAYGLNQPKDEESFFKAIHNHALNQEIDTVIKSGKAEGYLRYLENYIKSVNDKITKGEITVSDEDMRIFMQRQEERLNLLREKI